VESPAVPATPVATQPPVAIGDDPVAAAGRRVSAAANALLRTDNASSYARPFARQIGKIAALAERIALEAGSSGHGAAKTVNQLRKLEDLLSEIASIDSLGSKRQDRFADALRDRRHKLVDAFDSDDAPDVHSGQTVSSRKSDKSEKKGRKDQSA
jgi:hypothetical protein